VVIDEAALAETTAEKWCAEYRLLSTSLLRYRQRGRHNNDLVVGDNSPIDEGLSIILIISHANSVLLPHAVNCERFCFWRRHVCGFFWWPFVKWFTLCYRTVVCPVLFCPVLSVCLSICL